MRRFLFLIPLVGLVSSCVLDAPDIDVVSRHDFGVVHKGQVATVSLIVRNTGSAPLEISYVSTSCGCTKTSIDPPTMTIPAGGQRVLRVSYDSGAHDTDIGEVTRYVFISSNDPDESDFRIELKMNVVTP